MNVPAWLPPLIELSDHGGNWHHYIDAVYAVFHRDFVARRALFNGRKLLLIGRDTELVRGKERRFWHCVSDGAIEDERLLDLRRCERMSWMRPVIENAFSSNIAVWTEKHSGKGVRPHLWFNEEYLVVLERLWKGDYRPITTLHTLKEHQVRKYRKRRDEWQTKNAAREDGV